MTTDPHSPRRWRGSALLATVVVAAVALSACSSSVGNTTSSGASTTSSGAGDASSGATANVAAANAAVAKASKAPTTIGVTTPLKSKPPTGKTYVFLGVPFGSVAENISGLTAAAKAVGWNVKTIQYDQTSPATLITAFKEALQYHPVAVSLTGISESLWKSVIPEYRAAGVPIIPDCDPTPINDVVIANVCGSSDFSAVGKTLAQWFIADSKGTGNALIDHTPDFPILEALADSFTTTVKHDCSGCSVDSVTSNVAQAIGNQIQGQLVSALQKNSKINYLILPFAQFAQGMTSQLAAAGLSNRVKVALQGPTKQDLANMASGKVDAIIPLASTYQGWLDIDVALRHLEGMPHSANDGGLPYQLLTPSSKYTGTDDYLEPANFPTLFKKLWLVG